MLCRFSKFWLNLYRYKKRNEIFAPFIFRHLLAYLVVVVVPVVLVFSHFPVHFFSEVHFADLHASFLVEVHSLLHFSLVHFPVHFVEEHLVVHSVFAFVVVVVVVVCAVAVTATKHAAIARVANAFNFIVFSFFGRFVNKYRNVKTPQFE